MAGYLSPERFAAVMQRQKEGNPDWRLIAIRKGLLSPQQRGEIDRMIIGLADENEHCYLESIAAMNEFDAFYKEKSKYYNRPKTWLGKWKS